MNTNEQVAVANIFRAARTQLVNLRDSLDKTSAQIEKLWKRQNMIIKNASEVSHTFTLFAYDMRSTTESVRKILGNLKDYPLWNDSLRKKYLYRVNYTLALLRMQMTWVLKMNQDLTRRIEAKGFGYGPSLENWKIELDSCSGRDIRSVLNRYIDIMDTLISETGANQKRGKQGGNALTMPTICPHCGVKNPIGRKSCLRCENEF